jgi:hypothetical protein
MHEKNKLAEAEYFLARMRETQDDPTAFDFNLSAFLASSRSVLQYAREDAKTHGAQAWYDKAMKSADPSVAFLGEKRNISVHTNPVRPSRHINVELHDRISLSSELSAVVIRRDGSSEPQMLERQPKDVPTASVPDDPPVVTYRHQFVDWAGEEDILALAVRYLDALRAIVHDGLGRGVLVD